MPTRGLCRREPLMRRRAHVGRRLFHFEDDAAAACRLLRGACRSFLGARLSGGAMMRVVYMFLARMRARFVDHPSAGSLDRKSTRLNSSHLGISYAVFCLKKK